MRFSYLTDGDITDMAERWPTPAAGGPSRVIDLTESAARTSSPFGHSEGQ